jgi:hypothetical protein
MSNDSARIERALARIETVDRSVSNLENYMNTSFEVLQNSVSVLMRSPTDQTSKERDHHNVFLQDYATVYTQWRPAPL